jgi:YVTN family beta-propeller protein
VGDSHYHGPSTQAGRAEVPSHRPIRRSKRLATAALRVVAPRRLARILPVLLGAALVVSMVGVAPASAASGTPTNTVTSTIDVGSAPSGVAVNPAGTLAYVANDGSGTVSVVDTSTNTVTSTINVGSDPDGVAVNPTGTYTYVTNAGSGTVSVIDTSTNTVTSTISVGEDPVAVAVNPAGTIAYVTNEVSGTVSVIDTSTNTVASTITVGEDPSGVAVNPAGTPAYVVNPESSVRWRFGALR